VYLALGISKSVILQSGAPYEWRDTHSGPSGVVRVEVCLRGILGDCERREIGENESEEKEKREG
jgi:hypothetical protein